MEAKTKSVPEVKLISLRLTHDYWPTKGHIDKTSGEWVEERVKAGSIVQVPIEEAMKLIEARKAERLDPLQ